MKVQNSYSSTTFGNEVIIKYSGLKKLGEEAVRAAEKVKPRLEKRGDNMKYIISRAKDYSCDIPLSTNKIAVNAKITKINLKQRFENFFRVSPEKVVNTPTFSERALMRAANKAEKRAKNEKGQNILALILQILRPPIPL